MAISDFLEQALTKAQQAYLDILDGTIASYSIAGRSITKQNIDVLMNHIESLQAKIDSKKYGGGFSVADMSTSEYRNGH